MFQTAAAAVRGRVVSLASRPAARQPALERADNGGGQESRYYPELNSSVKK